MVGNFGAVMAADFHGQGERPASAPRQLFTITGIGGGDFGFGRSYAVTPDGQRFLAIVCTTDAAPHSATVLLNWRAVDARK